MPTALKGQAKRRGWRTTGIWYVLAATLALQAAAFNNWLGLTRSYPDRVVAASFAAGLVLFLPAMLMKKRLWAYLYLGAMSALTSVVMAANYLYFIYSGSFLQAAVLRYGDQTGAVLDSAFAIGSGALLLFVVGPLLVAIWALLIDAPSGERLRPTPRHWAVVLVLVIAGFGHMAYQEYRHLGNFRQLTGGHFDQSELIGKIGVLNYSFSEVARYFAPSQKVSGAEKALAWEWLKNKPQAPKPAHFGIAQGKNLILVQLESFEAMAINRHLDGQEITPNLNKLVGESLYFENYFYQAGPGTTADAEFSVFTGLFPPMTQVPYFEYPGNEYRALPSALRAKGYYTAVLHGDEPTFWNRSGIYPSLGINKYFDISEFRVERSVGFGHGLLDEDFFTQSVAKLRQFTQPFMATLIALTSHTPFELPKDLQGLEVKNPDQLSGYQLGYLQSLNYVDSSVGKLVERLKKAGLWESSVVVFYGDHASFAFKSDDTKYAQWLGLQGGFNEQSFLMSQRVPLLIHLPGDQLKGRSAKPGSHIDLYPTLANLLALEQPIGAVGSDLLAGGAVQVSRNRAGQIEAIIGPELSYWADPSGEFEKGQCLESFSPDIKPVSLCRELYDEQILRVKVSDLIIRGNLLLGLN